MFSPCHNNKNNKNNNKKNPHQNPSEGDVLEVYDLTHKLLRGFWLSLWGYEAKGPMSQEEQEQQQKIFYANFFLDKGFTLTGVLH